MAAKLFKQKYRDKKTGENKETAKWYGRLPNGNKIPLATNKATAEAMYRKALDRYEREQAGLIDPYEDHITRPLREHIADWLASVKATGTTESRVKVLGNYVGAMFEGCLLFRDIREAKAQQFVGGLFESGKLSAGTCANYVRAARQFTKWMVDANRSPSNPLRTLKPPASPTNHRKRVFAALTLDEVNRLIAAAGSGRVRAGLSGRDRSVLYRVAIETGYRPVEISRLVPSDFQLDTDTPSITLDGTRTKNHKPAEQFITHDTAAILREYLQGRRPGKRIWRGKKLKNVKRFLPADLLAAGLPLTKTASDGSEMRVSLYSLRHSLPAILEANGATLREAMNTMRHSDPKLTMQTYGRKSREELAGIVNKLPVITTPTPDSLAGDVVDTIEPPTTPPPDTLPTPTPNYERIIKPQGGQGGLGGHFKSEEVFGMNFELVRTLESHMTYTTPPDGIVTYPILTYATDCSGLDMTTTDENTHTDKQSDIWQTPLRMKAYDDNGRRMTTYDDTQRVGSKELVSYYHSTATGRASGEEWR